MALLGGLYSFAIALITGDTSNPTLLLLVPAFGAWAALPFALLYWRASSLAGRPVGSIIILIVSLIAAGLSFFVYWTTFVDNPKPDAQDGLVLLIIPLYQLAGVSILSLIAGWISKLAD